MSLYKENKFKSFFENKNIWIIIGVIILVLIIGYFATFINWTKMFEKENIKISFSENPIVLSKKDNTLMNVTLINNTENDLENLEVKIKDVENSFIVFCPDSKEEDKTKVIIPKIAKGNERIVTCNIRYDRTKDFFEGTYSFDVDYFIGDLVYTKRVNLEVKR